MKDVTLAREFKVRLTLTNEVVEPFSNLVSNTRLGGRGQAGTRI